jgi:hypothetical protein
VDDVEHVGVFGQLRGDLVQLAGGGVDLYEGRER